MDRVTSEPDAVGDAELAFEALRAEVAAVHQAVERLAAVLDTHGRQPDPVAPDYSPTLGAIAKALCELDKRLDGIEAQPALRLTPESYADQVTTGVRRAQDVAGRSLTQAQTRFSDGLAALQDVIGSVHAQSAQRQREKAAVAIGAVLGLLVWFPVVWLTPFGGGHWLAAAMIGGDRWVAGETLMQEANAETWGRMVRLYQACPRTSATELCETAMAAPTVPAAPVPAPIAPAQSPARNKAGR